MYKDEMKLILANPGLGPLHMSPVTGLARLPGRILWSWCVRMGNFIRSTGMNSRNTTKMVEHKLVSFATVIALWTLVTSVIKLIHILLYQIIPFWPLCCESEAILSKQFRPGHWAGVFIWEHSRSRYRDLDNRASPASHMNTCIHIMDL